MDKISFRKAFIVVAGLLVPSLVLAAGLGRLTVHSALGQPLRAEIEIVSLQPDEASSLSARLASIEAFRQANIEVNSALYSIRFAIEQRPGGERVLTLISSESINEPFLDMLVELSSSGSRLIREYTFLLDPIEFKGPVAAAVPPVPPLAVQPLPAAVAKPAPTAAVPPRAAGQDCTADRAAGCNVSANAGCPVPQQRGRIYR